MSTVEISQQRILIDCTTAHQMWQALSAQHLEQASDNLYDLQARFYQYQYKEGNDMKTHIADIKAIAHHLSEVDKAIEERELITKIVCTLPAPYRNFVSSWRHNPMDRQTMVSLTSLLLQEEREISRWTPKGASNQETALHASKSNIQRILTYLTRGNITIQLTSFLISLDSKTQVNLVLIQQSKAAESNQIKE